jgi:hypothetical protein
MLGFSAARATPGAMPIINAAKAAEIRFRFLLMSSSSFPIPAEAVSSCFFALTQRIRA